MIYINCEYEIVIGSFTISGFGHSRCASCTLHFSISNLKNRKEVLGLGRACIAAGARIDGRRIFTPHIATTMRFPSAWQMSSS